MKITWEKICDEPITKRVQVFGGWLVLCFDVNEFNTDLTCESMVFVPDAGHQWE